VDFGNSINATQVRPKGGRAILDSFYDPLDFWTKEALFIGAITLRFHHDTASMTVPITLGINIFKILKHLMGLRSRARYHSISGGHRTHKAHKTPARCRLHPQSQDNNHNKHHSRSRAILK